MLGIELSLDDPLFLSKFEEALTLGAEALLFLHCDTNESVRFIEKFMCKQTVTKEGVKSFCFANKYIPYQELPLYFHTQIRVPQFNAMIHSECSLLNFEITQVSVEEYILQLLLKRENYPLFQKLVSIKEEMALTQTEVEKGEIDILTDIFEYQGELLDNTDLVLQIEEYCGNSTSKNQHLVTLEHTYDTLLLPRECYRLLS